MLLFPALAAAWFLRLRWLYVHMVVITGVCPAALWPSYASTVGLAAPGDGEDPVAALWRLVERADTATYATTYPPDRVLDR